MRDRKVDVLVADIDRLAELEDDWDSYGAAPISPEAIKLAQSLVRHPVIRAVGLPVAIGATADSGVALRWKWQASDPSLDIVITAEGGRYAVLQDRKLIQHGGITGDIADFAINACREWGKLKPKTAQDVIAELERRAAAGHDVILEVDRENETVRWRDDSGKVKKTSFKGVRNTVSRLKRQQREGEP